MIMMGDKKRAITAILGPKANNVGVKGEEDAAPQAGHSIAEEMIEAFHAKDAPALWESIKAAFAELDSEPHVEGPHLED